MMYVSACLRPHQELRIQTLGTRMHNYMATMYMFLSVGICASLYLKIESVEKKLYSILNNSVQKVSKLSMLLWLSGIWPSFLKDVSFSVCPYNIEVFILASFFWTFFFFLENQTQLVYSWNWNYYCNCCFYLYDNISSTNCCHQILDTYYHKHSGKYFVKWYR